MERNKDTSILVAVRAIIVDGKNRVMLIKRTKRASFAPNQWCLVGGKVDEGETPIASMDRELSEEIGKQLTLSYWKEIENPDTSSGARWNSHYFTGRLDELPTDLEVDEVSDIGFFTLDQIMELDIAFDHREVLNQYFAKINK